MISKRIGKRSAFFVAACVIVQALPFSLQITGETGLSGKTAEILREANVYASEEPSSISPASPVLGQRFEIDGVGYRKVTENTVQLTDWADASGDIVIPEKAPGTGLTVTSIGDSVFRGKAGIESITLPDTVTDIGNYAFYSTLEAPLPAVELPPNLVSIGEYAFAAEINGVNSGRWDLVIPDTVKVIGRHAYEQRSDIQSVKLPENLTKIEYGTFYLCDGLTHVTLGNRLKIIGPYAFYQCNLKEINFPETLTEIGAYAFFLCYTLAEITVPDGVHTIGKSAFEHCYMLSRVTLPDSLSSVGARVFSSCKSLQAVTIPEGVTRLNAAWFESLPDAATASIKGDAAYVDQFFCGEADIIRLRCKIKIICESEQMAARLYSVGHTNIELNGEAYAPEETGLNFSDGVFRYTVINPQKKQVRLEGTAEGAAAPAGKVAIPETVTDENGVSYTVAEIGHRAFYENNEITGIELPDSVMYIGQEAFYECTQLAEIYLPENLVSLGRYAFHGCMNLTGTLAVPDGCTDISSGLRKTGYSEIILPEGIKELESGAFSGCANLVSVTLPENLEKIGDSIFSGCENLQTVTMPKQLKEIGNAAFYGCTSLSGPLVLPDSVEVIEGDAFKGCSGLICIRAGEGLQFFGPDAAPDSARLTAYTDRTLEILVRSTDRMGESLPLLLWNGKRDVPAGRQLPVEGDTVISGSVTIGEGAVITVSPGASLTVAEGARLTIADGAQLIISDDAQLSVADDAQLTVADGAKMHISQGASAVIDGTLVNNGITAAEGAFTNNGTLEIGGGLTAEGSFTNNGTLSGDGTFASEKTPEGTGSFVEGLKISLALTEAMIADVPDLVYNVTPHAPEPEVSVDLGSRRIQFEKDADFTYEYADNRLPGQASVIVTPKEGGRLSGSSVTKYFTIDKALQEAKKACILTFEEGKDGKTYTAVISETDGAEYSFDGENFSDENKKSGCLPQTEYTAYIRIKETETHYAGPVTENTASSPKLKAPEISTLKAELGKTGVYVDVTAAPVFGADRYEIYRVSKGTTVLLGTVPSGAAAVQDANPAQSAGYYAVAVSKDGKVKSAAGSPKELTLAKGAKIKKASAVSGGIRITWKKVKNAKKYVLYRSTNKNSGYTKIKTLGKNKLSYTDKKAKKNKKYYYKIAVLTKTQPSLLSKASKKAKR